MAEIPPTNRRHAVTWFILTAVYAGMAWQGLTGGVRDMGVSVDWGERLTSAGEILFGAGATVATAARLFAMLLSTSPRLPGIRRVAWWGAWAWAVGSVVAGSSASATFGGAPLAPTIASAAAVLAIVAGILAVDRWSWPVKNAGLAGA